MKKSIQFSLLLAFLTITACIDPVTAQDAKKELAAFTKQFQDSYNKKDVKAIKEMFTKDAVRTSTDGQTQNGNEAIAAAYEETMQNNLTVTIKQDKVVTEKDGSTVATGTYHVTGSANSGEKIDISGGYTHTVVKEGGHWKIAKQVLTEL